VTANPPSEKTAGTPTISNSETPFDLQRLEKATKRVERLSYVVAAELAGLLVVIVLLLFTFGYL
jgi:hypothetical protein